MLEGDFNAIVVKDHLWWRFERKNRQRRIIKKITKEELELITNQQQELGQHLKNIGIIEVEKRNIQDKIKVVSDEIEKAKNDLEKKYGSINIDLKDGSYTEVVKEDDKQD